MIRETRVAIDARIAGTSAPRVTIAIPVYNGEQYLAKTIDSILSQTFQNFEIILCDNASTDQTGEICSAYAGLDERIRYYRNETNIGWAGNHNRAVDLARGEYFKWAAYDDLLDPTFIEQCVDVLDAHPDVALCYPQTQFIDEQDAPLHTYADQLDLTEPRANQRFYTFFQRQSLSHPVFGVSRTETLRRTGRMGSFIMSDRVWIGEMALNGKIVELPGALFLRRIHDSNSTTINQTGSQMLTWINPRTRTKFFLPKWRRLYEYFKAIGRARMTTRERLACYLTLTRFIFIPGRWAGLLSDIARFFIRRKKKTWMN